jgi:hypothetical protein
MMENRPGKHNLSGAAFWCGKMYFMGLRMGKIVEWVVSPITGFPPKPRNAQDRSETL